MRSLLLIALLPGCILPTNEISGRWNVGGEGGCTPGETVMVHVPEDWADNNIHYPCTEREFSIPIDAELTEMRVQFDVWPLVDRGVDRGATVELFRVVDDFNIGLVTFVELSP